MFIQLNYNICSPSLLNLKPYAILSSMLHNVHMVFLTVRGGLITLEEESLVFSDI